MLLIEWYDKNHENMELQSISKTYFYGFLSKKELLEKMFESNRQTTSICRLIFESQGCWKCL